MTATQVIVGRQPIFDASFDVVGYEVLHAEHQSSRDDPSRADVSREDRHQLFFDMTGVGISRLVGDGLLFCDLDRATVTGGIPVMLPASRTVLEVDAGEPVDDELLAGLEVLVGQGFRIAIDHVRDGAIDERLLGLAFLVKVERAAATPALLEQIRGLQHDEASVHFVVLGVETAEDLAACSAAGFSYFQGSLLSNTQVVSGKVPAVAGHGRLKMAADLVATECSAHELERAIRGDPGMVYQLLQMAAIGSYHGLRREIASVREALVLLGWQRVQAWLSFLLATAESHAGEEEVLRILVRARMCELLAEQLVPGDAELAFTAGMVSAFDRMLDLDVEDVLIQLTSDGPLRDAVRQEQTPVGDIVADVVACQDGGSVGRTGLSDVVLHAASVDALGWALDAVRSTGIGARQHAS